MATDDFFRARLNQMIDLAHPLAVLAMRMPWAAVATALAPAFAHKDRVGRQDDRYERGWRADAALWIGAAQPRPASAADPFDGGAAVFEATGRLQLPPPRQVRPAP